MASFDFIDAAAKGYEFIWRHRSYLSRVIFPVVFVKIVCVLSVFVWKIESDKLREGLVMMPSYVLDALLIAGLIRFFLYREPIFIWGKAVTPPIFDKKHDHLYKTYGTSYGRQDSMKASIAFYLLSIIVILVMSSILPDQTTLNALENKEATQSGMPALSPLAPLLLIMAFIGIFWSVRLFWLFAPASMGYSPKTYLTAIKGFKISFCLILTWIVCTLPISVLYEVFSSAPRALFGAGSAAQVFSNAVLRSIAEIIAIATQAIAGTYGIYVAIHGGKAPENKIRH